MTPLEFMKNKPKEEWHRVAFEAKTTPAYFEQVARGYSNASIGLAKRLKAASGNEMSLPEIIPALSDEAA
jgi:hypothetical protein